MTHEPAGPGPDRDDDIATLVRLAGKRAAVPAERAARVREAAHATWNARVGRRRRRRRLVWSVAAAASVAFAFFLVIRGGPFDATPAGSTRVSTVVEAVSGTVRLADTPGLAVGDTLEVGDSLTTGDDGRVAVRLAGGHSLRLDSSTTIVIEADRLVALHHGALYVDSGPDADPRAAVEVRTSQGTIREIGTQFAVRASPDGTLTVRLREGTVIVEHDGDRLDVKAGAELSIDADGTIHRGRIAPDDARWSWTETIAPPIELSNRTAHSILEQIARERGWTLAFSDARAARQAMATVLGGSLEAMPVIDALEAVLPTCRLDGRVIDGRLIVSAEPDS